MNNNPFHLKMAKRFVDIYIVKGRVEALKFLLECKFTASDINSFKPFIQKEFQSRGMKIEHVS